MIGYYAHSHGSGHSNCANIFAKIFGDSLTILTDRTYRFDNPDQVVKLENENSDGTEFIRDDFPEPRALHYAPVNLRKITRRNRAMLDAIVLKNISLLIVDVSVEVAMLARVSSIPYAYVRLQGDRSDLPHLNAFEGASFLLAYYPREMESVNTPAWIVDKTIYLGFLSQFMFDRPVSQRPVEFVPSVRPIIAHISGFGGSRGFDLTPVVEHFDIYAIGPGDDAKYHIPGIEHIGIVDDISPYIEHADIIVAACGLNVTAEILSLGKRFLAIPEKRHYGEQVHMAHNLHRLGWAVDTSKYDSTGKALNTLIGADRTILPKVRPNELKAFRAKMEFYGYQADQLVPESHRRSEDRRSKADAQKTVIF